MKSHLLIDVDSNDPRLRHFARWVNRLLFKSVEWNDYDRLPPLRLGQPDEGGNGTSGSGVGSISQTE